MSEPRCLSLGAGGKQNVLLGTSAAAMCLKKALMNRGGRRGVARVWGESSVALLSSGSVLLSCTIHLITRQEDTEGCHVCVCMCVLIHLDFH